MLPESTAPSHLVQLLQRDLGRKHLPDEEHRQEYQVDLSDELQHWWEEDALLLGLTIRMLIHQFRFKEWYSNYGITKKVVEDGINCLCFFQAASLETQQQFKMSIKPYVSLPMYPY